METRQTGVCTYASASEACWRHANPCPFILFLLLPDCLSRCAVETPRELAVFYGPKVVVQIRPVGLRGAGGQMVQVMLDGEVGLLLSATASMREMV